MAEQGPLSGQTVGTKYRIGELLGVGGFGVVYKAQHLHLQRQQAIKILLEHLFLKGEFRSRFLREAQIVAALDHPYIIHLDDFWVEPTCAYLVMPFISGGTLQDILQKQQSFLKMEQVLSYLEYICTALDYAHARGVAHLDLKPLNLLVHQDGRLLLSDFGLAHLMKQGAIEGGTSLRLGTPHYMAPEHIRGNPERRSDIFALGVILYQMLVGRRPFQGLPPEAVMLKNITEWPSPPRAFRPELPQEVENVLRKALAKQPEQRYQTASDLLAAFKKALAAPITPPIALSRHNQVAPLTRENPPVSPVLQSPALASHQGRHLRLDPAQLTDVGRKRPHNEDNMAYVIPKDPVIMGKQGALFIVADGMQDRPAGEVASEIAVDAVINTYYQEDSDRAPELLLRAIKRANALIYQRAAENMLRRGMGTTCVAASIRGSIAYFANVGNSRAYFVRNGQIKRVSQDHSWVEEQVRAGVLSEEQARSHARRNVITRSLGTQPDVEVDIFYEKLQEGDTLLLCSDGLSGLVSDDDMRTMVEQYPPQESVYHLVERANENGGPDNITVIVVRVLEVGLNPPNSPTPR